MRFIISATLLSLASFASAQTSASSTPAAAPAVRLNNNLQFCRL